MSEIKILLVQLLAKDQQELMVIPDDRLVLKLKFARELVDLYEIIAPCKCVVAIYYVYAALSQVFVVFMFVFGLQAKFARSARFASSCTRPLPSRHVAWPWKPACRPRTGWRSPCSMWTSASTICSTSRTSLWRVTYSSRPRSTAMLCAWSPGSPRHRGSLLQTLYRNYQ